MSGAFDVHSHFTPPDVVDWFRNEHNPIGTHVAKNADGRDGIVQSGRWFPIAQEQYDVALWKQMMEGMGFDSAILSPTPWLFFYEADPADAAALCRRVNEGMAHAATTLGHGYYSMGLLPLQDPEKAAAELRYGVETLGLKGMEIGCRVGDKELDEGFDAVWEAAAALNVPLFLHPLGWVWRLSRHYFGNLIGVPTDTAIAAGSLIFGGVLDRHPNLKVILSHGGGAAPYLLGRWTHGYRVRPENQSLPRAPREYLDQIYFDTITHDPVALRYLLETARPGHVLAGSDFPFDMGPAQPLEDVEEAKLDEATVAGIRHGNAGALYGFD